MTWGRAGPLSGRGEHVHPASSSDCAKFEMIDLWTLSPDDMTLAMLVAEAEGDGGPQPRPQTSLSGGPPARTVVCNIMFFLTKFCVIPSF